jgi:molybdopterin molybdotransferase
VAEAAVTDRPHVHAHDLPWDEARQRAAGLGRPQSTERVALEDADRRVLARNVAALTDLPGFDASAMDGWAVSGEGPWAIVGSVLAGMPSPTQLLGGTAVRIATGAPTPAGARIIRSENGVVDDHGQLTGDVVSADIRPRGEECRAGETLGVAGLRLTPPVIGLLAAAGHDGLTVMRRPRVRLVLLGDELLQSGMPGDGRVRDALGPQLPAWMARLGAEVVDVRRLSDSLGALTEALSRGDVDLVISTGGTAGGPRDHVHEAVASLGGTFAIDGVSVRPGHPMALADLGDRPPLVALPGNPQAAIVGLLTLAVPLIGSQLATDWDADEQVVLTERLNAPDDQTRLVGGVRDVDGFIRARYDGSAMLRGLAASTGYAVIPPGGARPGDVVRWLPLP